MFLPGWRERDARLMESLKDWARTRTHARFDPNQRYEQGDYTAYGTYQATDWGE